MLSIPQITGTLLRGKDNALKIARRRWETEAAPTPVTALASPGDLSLQALPPLTDV